MSSEKKSSRKSSVDSDVKSDDESKSSVAGDWVCVDADCANVNFAKRTSCNRCGKDRGESLRKKKLGQEIGKAAAEKSRGLFSADDWQCNKCGNVNWARRQQCNMCNAPKFGEVEERTGYGGGYNDRGVVEYKDRRAVDDDDDYDEFGRRRKKKRTESRSDDDSKHVKHSSSLHEKSNSQSKHSKSESDQDDDRDRKVSKKDKKYTKQYSEDEEEDEEDEDDEDLSKYDLSEWDDLKPDNKNSDVVESSEKS